MATKTVKLKGTLKLGSTTGMQLEAQISQIGTPQTVNRDSPVTVLTGDVIQAPATYSYALSGTMLLDLLDAQGVYAYVQGLIGTEQQFDFEPAGTGGPHWTGTVIVDGFNTEELNAGALIVSKFSWPIQGQPTITPPAALAADAEPAA
jgi:hypothetical protein